MVSFTLLSRVHAAPEGVTIIQALEYAGVRSPHGSSCRQGFCGACAMLCRFPGETEVRGVLGCQTLIVEGLDVCQVPHFPVNRADFDVTRPGEPGPVLKQLYPELDGCIHCGACNRACPVTLDVRGFVADLIAADLPAVARASDRCVSCGLCAARCPSGIAPYVVALQARRAEAYRSPRSPMLRERCDEIRAGRYDETLAELSLLAPEELKDCCAELRERAIASARRS